LRRLRDPNQQAAWERFVELYAPLIFHWSKSRGLSATDASDLVQEVMTVLVQKLPDFQYDPTKRFRGWLRTITINKTRDFQRHEASRPHDADTPTLQLVATPGTVDLFDEAEYRSFLVNRALELMRTEFRDEVWQACWQQVVEGKKAVDVARELKMTVNRVYLAKSRVLGRLREELVGLMD